MLFSSLFLHNPEMVKVPAGGTLFREGDTGDAMYVLVGGSASVSVNGHVVERAEIGAILGELSVIEPNERSATVKALCECTFAKVDEKRFRFLVSETPHFALEVMRVMARRLRQADEMIA